MNLGRRCFLAFDGLIYHANRINLHRHRRWKCESRNVLSHEQEYYLMVLYAPAPNRVIVATKRDFTTILILLIVLWLLRYCNIGAICAYLTILYYVTCVFHFGPWR